MNYIERISESVIHRLDPLLEPRPRLTIAQWADQYRYLAKGVSAKSKHGDVRYRTATAPHQILPMQSFTDPAVQMTVLDMASQVGGKTEIMLNAIGYHMHWIPTNIVVMYPTVEASERFSKKKLTPAIDASPVLREIVFPSRSTKNSKGNTILVKDFLGGSIFLCGSNSPPSLRGATGEILIADEIDAYEPEAGDEGDPLELLWKRGESYPDCVKIVASTPTVEGVSRIDRLMQETDYQKWFMPCPRCGAEQVFQWDHVKWPKDKPELAFYECDKCNAELSDDDRRAMYYAGHWQATKPFTGKRGFHLNGIYAPWPHQKGFRSRLHQMADEFLRASRKETTLKVWINTFCCETWKLKGEAVEVKDLLSRCELYRTDPLPEKVLCIVGAADVQQDRIEATLFGVGDANEIWCLQHTILMGNTDATLVWDALDQLTLQEFNHPCGSKLKIACFLVDMGFRPKQVIRFTKARQGRRIYACAGSKTDSAPLVSRPRKSTIRQATRFEIGGNTAKETLYDRLKNVTTPGPRYIHFPVGYGFDEEYFLQLAAEICVPEYDDRGIEIKRTWVKQRQRNEALDIFIYGLGAIEILNPDYKALAKLLAVKPANGISLPNAERQEPPKPAPETPQQVIRRRIMPVRRTGWVNGWRR